MVYASFMTRHFVPFDGKQNAGGPLPAYGEEMK